MPTIDRIISGNSRCKRNTIEYSGKINVDVLTPFFPLPRSS